MQILFLILLKPHLLHEKSVNIFSGSEAFTHLARWMPLLAKGTLPAMLPQAASYKGWGVHQQCWLCPCLLRLSHRSCQPWGGGGGGGRLCAPRSCSISGIPTPTLPIGCGPPQCCRMCPQSWSPCRVLCPAGSQALHSLTSPCHDEMWKRIRSAGTHGSR